MGESHVVSALKAKRAELAGEIERAEKEVAQLRADLVHLDATLRMFDAAADPDVIPAKGPYKRRGWFRRGELPRRILDTLRASPEPLSPSEIAGRIMVQNGLDAGDGDTLALIRKGVQTYLRRQRGHLVQHVGRKGRNGRWRVNDVAAQPAL